VIAGTNRETNESRAEIRPRNEGVLIQAIGFEQFQAETAEQFERIYLLPFEWMDVTESDLHIAFTTGDSPKSFAIGLGVNLKLRPSIPD
jgi:hypothetical protein